MNIEAVREIYTVALRNHDETTCAKLDAYWLCACNAPFDVNFCVDCSLPRGLKDATECVDLLRGEGRKDNVKL